MRARPRPEPSPPPPRPPSDLRPMPPSPRASATRGPVRWPIASRVPFSSATPKTSLLPVPPPSALSRPVCAISVRSSILRSARMFLRGAVLLPASPSWPMWRATALPGSRAAFVLRGRRFPPRLASRAHGGGNRLAGVARLGLLLRVEHRRVVGLLRRGANDERPRPDQLRVSAAAGGRGHGGAPELHPRH